MDLDVADELSVLRTCDACGRPFELSRGLTRHEPPETWWTTCRRCRPTRREIAQRAPKPGASPALSPPQTARGAAREQARSRFNHQSGGTDHGD